MFVRLDLKYLQIMNLKESVKCMNFFKKLTLFMALFIRQRMGLLMQTNAVAVVRNDVKLEFSYILLKLFFSKSVPSVYVA